MLNFISALLKFSGAQNVFNSVTAGFDGSAATFGAGQGADSLKHYSIRTEQAYLDWIKRFIRHFGKRHPRDMGAKEVREFLTHLAVAGKVAASTQNQAKSALLFLYREVLDVELPWLDDVEAAKTPKRLPVVLTRDEVMAMLARLEGSHGLIARLLYGTGLRVMECLRLRVKDVVFERGEILVRDGKGFKDRFTMLPASMMAALREHMERVRELHRQDLAVGHGEVHLPYALDRKYPAAGREWMWQYIFPSAVLSVDPRSGVVRRHHLQDQSVQRAIKGAVRAAGLTSRRRRTHCVTVLPPICWKAATTSAQCRNCSAMPMCKTTMIYTHVLNKRRARRGQPHRQDGAGVKLRFTNDERLSHVGRVLDSESAEPRRGLAWRRPRLVFVSVCHRLDKFGMLNTLYV